MAKAKAAAKKENLDDLKQELDIDYHKITSDELYQRFQTHPENVSEFVNERGSILIDLCLHCFLIAFGCDRV